MRSKICKASHASRFREVSPQHTSLQIPLVVWSWDPVLALAYQVVRRVALCSKTPEEKCHRHLAWVNVESEALVRQLFSSGEKGKIYFGKPDTE